MSLSKRTAKTAISITLIGLGLTGCSGTTTTAEPAIAPAGEPIAAAVVPQELPLNVTGADVDTAVKTSFTLDEQDYLDAVQELDYQYGLDSIANNYWSANDIVEQGWNICTDLFNGYSPNSIFRAQTSVGIDEFSALALMGLASEHLCPVFYLDVFDYLDDLSNNLPFLSSAPSNNYAPPSQVAATATENLKIREYAGCSAPVVGTIPQGADVTHYPASDNGDWIYVQYKGMEGYSSGYYLVGPYIDVQFPNC